MKPPHVILTVTATVVIFAAGVVTGGLLVRKVFPCPPSQQSGWPMARFDQFQRAVNTLDLKPEQRRKILAIIRERQDYVGDVMRVIEPDLPGLFVKMREDVNQELTAGQQHDLDELWNRIQQRRLANRGGEYVGRPGDNSGFPPERLFPPDRGRMRQPPGSGSELGSPRPGGPGPGPRRPLSDRPPPDRPLPDRPPPGSRPPPADPPPVP